MTDEAFSEQLQTWLTSEGKKTLGELGRVFEEKGFAVTILMLLFVPALPVPTGGITHVFEAIAVVLAAQMVIGRQTIWLPDRWKHRELGAATTEKALPFIIRRVRWFERFSRPRGAWLFEQKWMVRILGLVFIALSVAAAVAPPFSGLDTLPALGAVVVALGIILDDWVVLVIGVAIGAGGILLIVTVGGAIFRLVSGLL